MSLIFSTQFEKGSLIDRIAGNIGTLTANAEIKRTDKGLAFSGNGTDAYVSYGNTVTVPIAASTIVFWFKLNTDEDYQTIVGSQGDAFSYIRLGAGPDEILDNIIIESDANGDVEEVDWSESLELGQWYHGVVTIEAGSVKLYKNSIYQNTSSGTLIDDITFSDIGVARTNDGINGYIGKVEVYNHVFDTKEHIASYKQFVSAQPLGANKIPRYNPFSKPSNLSNEVGLVAAYNMIPSTGGILTDISGNGNNLTNINGPASFIDGMGYDGISQYSKSDTFTDLHGLTAATFCVRYKSTNGTSSESIFVQAYNGTTFFIKLNNGVLWAQTTGSTILTNANGDDGQWHNVVLTLSGANVILYVDGVNIDSASDGGVLVVSSDDALAIAAYADAGTATNYGEIEVEDARIYNHAFIEQQAKDYHNSFAKRIKLIEDFSYEKVGGNRLEGTVINSGTFELKEDSTGKYFECQINGTFSYGGVDLSAFSGNGWVKTLTGDLSGDEGDTVDNATNVAYSGGKLTVTMTTGQKLRELIITQAEEQ